MLKGLLAGFRSLVKGEAKGWDFQDRRKLVRMRCHYDVKAECGGKKFDATILDMGLRGMRIRCFHPLKLGEAVNVWTPIPIVGGSNEPVTCKVVWSRQPDRNFCLYAGMTYESDDKLMARSWVKYFLKELGFKPEVIYSKRKYVRAECYMTGEYTDPQGVTREMRVYNLGVGGTLIETHAEHPLGSVFQLRIGPYENLPVLEATGTLKMEQTEGKLHLCGVEFDEMTPHAVKILGQYLKVFMKSGWAE